MRMQSGSLRQEVYLTSCPACGARNALNGHLCWRCEHELPPATADELIAALDALASERGLRRGLIGPDALRSPADEPPRPRRPAVAHAAPVPCGPQPALRRPAPTRERFGLFVDGGPAPSDRRRSLRIASVGLAFVALVVAGYPVYRSGERALSRAELRRMGPPAWHRLDATRLSTADAIPAALGSNESGERTAAVPQGARETPSAVPVATRIDPLPQVQPALGGARERITPANQPRARHETGPPNGTRQLSAARHAPLHAQRTSGSTLHVAHASRGHAGPVLVAGGVSLRDLALGR
jgi:hypothetical protein